MLQASTIARAAWSLKLEPEEAHDDEKDEDHDKETVSVGRNSRRCDFCGVARAD